jgi:hypothetical protein
MQIIINCPILVECDEPESLTPEQEQSLGLNHTDFVALINPRVVGSPLVPAACISVQ